MTIQKQKFISALLVAIVVIGGFQALVYIINLNQPVLFLQVAAALYVYLWLKIAFLYDLHFKHPGALKRAKIMHESTPHWLKRGARIFFSACRDRVRHLLHWDSVRHWLNYLVLPALIFWSTVAMLYLNLGHLKTQEIVVTCSSVALIFSYWYLKEIFHRRQEIVDRDIFTAFSAIKLYTAFLFFAAALALTQWFGLETYFLFLVILDLTFWLLYQALFQHGLVSFRTMLLAIGVSLVMAAIATIVYVEWNLVGVYLFTAAAFLLAWYNFFWNLLHNYLHKKLTTHFIISMLFFTLFICMLLISVTNFKARIAPL